MLCCAVTILQVLCVCCTMLPHLAKPCDYHHRCNYPKWLMVLSVLDNHLYPPAYALQCVVRMARRMATLARRGAVATPQCHTRASAGPLRGSAGHHNALVINSPLNQVGGWHFPLTVSLGSRACALSSYLGCAGLMVLGCDAGVYGHHTRLCHASLCVCVCVN